MGEDEAVYAEILNKIGQRVGGKKQQSSKKEDDLKVEEYNDAD